MPEKPEVITVAKKLEKELLERRILSCQVYWNHIIAYPSVEEFRKKIINQVIHSISTRGKFLVLLLDDYYLLIHLRMEGKFLFRGELDEISKHEHVEMILDNGVSWRYMDVRKFGRMYLFPKEKVFLEKPLSLLGMEYDDPLLTKRYLYDKIHSKKLPIKTVLLDQSIITGIGNIYANEILYLCHINPNRSASKISLKTCDDIIQQTRKVFDRAIQLGGSTIRSFTSSEGVHGSFQDELLVHGREGSLCSCGGVIKKVMIGGRGTYYCPKCQKK
ncbi:MAG: DNA-formamidopyrimidine glycosylase [Bacilli bacterium]|nr:DNA-formamidopyrimidine glycosylase [Bacilli bacterium]